MKWFRSFLNYFRSRHHILKEVRLYEADSIHWRHQAIQEHQLRNTLHRQLEDAHKELLHWKEKALTISKLAKENESV